MELKLTSRAVTDQQGRPRRFHYSLLVDQIQSGSFSCENYGVLVRDEDGSESSLPGITTNALRIDELISLLVEHNVGPASLRDVVDDWL